MIQKHKTLCEYKHAHDIEILLHSAGCHQGSCKAHQAGNQKSWSDIPTLMKINFNSFQLLYR